MNEYVNPENGLVYCHFKAQYILSIRDKVQPPPRIFIETGTHVGTTTLQMVDYFDIIHTIELKEPEFRGVQKIIDEKGISNITQYLGDSRTYLPKIIENINEPCVFWLDAHWHQSTAPLMENLESISQHSIKNHLILVDDVRQLRMWGCPMLEKTLQYCKDKFPQHHIYAENDIIHIVPENRYE